MHIVLFIIQFENIDSIDLHTLHSLNKNVYINKYIIYMSISICQIRRHWGRDKTSSGEKVLNLPPKVNPAESITFYFDYLVDKQNKKKVSTVNAKYGQCQIDITTPSKNLYHVSSLKD